jgi:CRISPR system Cascade subunit CasC
MQEESAEDLAKAVALFLRAFMFVMPTGKQSTFANRTVPDFVYLTIRKDQPANLAGAFEKAVSSGEQGYLEPSKKRLSDYADMLYSSFIEYPVKAYCVGKEDMPEPIERLTAKELLDSLRQDVLSYMETR